MSSTEFKADIQDIQFQLRDVLKVETLTQYEPFEEFDSDLFRDVVRDGARPGGEERVDDHVRPDDAGQEPLLGASRVGQLARAQRRVCHLQGLAERARPRRRDAPPRARAQVGEGGGRQPLTSRAGRFEDACK